MVGLNEIEKLITEKHDAEEQLKKTCKYDALVRALRKIYQEGFEYAVEHNLNYTFVDSDKIAELLGLDVKEEREYFRLRKERKNEGI